MAALRAGGRSTADKVQPRPAPPPRRPTPTPAEIAAHCALCWRLAQDARTPLEPLLPELVHLARTLADPALAAHPKREWGERRERTLGLRVREPLAVYLGHVVGAERAWQALTPDQRRAHGLDTLLGMDAGEHLLDARLDGWTPPEDVRACLPVAALILLGWSPF